MDRRNPEPQLFADPPEEQTPDFYTDDIEWQLPSIRAEMPRDLVMPGAHVYGYDYRASDQPYLIEIWTEKSTMNDVLLPICRRYGLNYVSALGFQSITSVISHLQRVAMHDKPSRILYISDHDPAGDKMPVGVARQLEYWLRQYAPGGHVALDPLVLTAAQVERYRLPRIPIKETDLRRENFERRHGASGAVELDALEALYPGVLASIVTEAVSEFIDRDLEGELKATEEQAAEIVAEAWDEETKAMRDRLDDIRQRAEAIAESYQARLDAVRGSMAAEMEPLQGELDALKEDLDMAVGGFNPDLPDRPEPSVDADIDDWLFDSGRSYLTQIDHYKAH